MEAETRRKRRDQQELYKLYGGRLIYGEELGRSGGRIGVELKNIRRIAGPAGRAGLPPALKSDRVLKAPHPSEVHII